MSQELVDLLDGADLYPPAFDGEFSWPEDAPETAPATFGLSLVADPPVKKSLRAHIEGVDAIAQTVESLDDEQLDDEARDELSAMLIAAIAGTKRKVDDTARVLSMFAHLEAAAKSERDRLDKRAKYFARQSERLETYLLATLEASKLDRLDGETSTLRRQRNPPRVVIAEGASVPHQFLVYPDAPPPHPDKAAIAKALKAKRTVAGCSLVADYRLVRS
jgi:hypothetical protein